MLDRERRTYRGNLHLHSTRSDGAYPSGATGRLGATVDLTLIGSSHAMSDGFSNMLVPGMAVASLAYVSMLAVASLGVLVVLAFAAGALGWRGAIAVCTAPMLLILPALALRYRSVERVERPNAGDLSLWRSTVSITRMVFRERNVLLLAVVYALSGMATKAAVGFMPLLAKARYGFDTSIIGVMLAVYFGMGIVAKPVMGVLYAKIGPRSALFAPLLVSFAATFAIGLAPWPELFLVLIALAGATSPISPVILTGASDYADPRVLASSVGLIYSLHAVGFVAPTVAGFLAERSGMAYAYAFAAALFLGAAAVALALRRRPSTERSSHE